jgi:glycosyltransferase involved in cell wall biosynthesis
VPARHDPVLTALLPVKSFHPTYLAKAVRSIAQQTEPNWRLIVVGERANEGEVAALLARELEDPRAKLIVNEGVRLPGAINTGMRHARSEFVAVLLGDDMWTPDAVTVLGSAIERAPDVDFFHTGRLIVDEHDRPISGVYRARTSFEIDEFVERSPVKHLLCWRRERALAIGGLDERGIIGPDDWDFPWAMAEAGSRFQAVPACLYHYRDHREGFRLTTHVPLRTQTRDIRRVLRKHGIGPVRSYRTVRSLRRRSLRQCLYRTSVDRFVKQRVLAGNARDGWRQTYR